MAEQDRINEYNQREIKRLQDNQNHFQGRVNVIDRKMQNFNASINRAEADKRMEEMMRLRNQEEQKQTMEREKSDIEREIKFANMREVNEGNKMLMMQKENAK